MAGFGMQLWGIVQDLSQLHRIYGDGWQTFIGNSGVLPPEAARPDAAAALPDFAAAAAYLESKGWQVRHGGWGKTVEVRRPSGSVETFPDDEAFITWVRADYGRGQA
jgi:hypothetical protein